MIRPINRDPLFLAQKSAPATPEDAPIARDLLETLTAHADGCVGMAANMIGEAKCIIAVESEDGYLVLFNPVILNKQVNRFGRTSFQNNRIIPRVLQFRPEVAA